MDTLLKQLKELPARFLALPPGLRTALLAGVGVAVMLAVAVGAGMRAEEYQYAFTNLTQEDSTEAAGILTTSKIPYRLEANGSALAVPADKVYDARILLATAGLPRGGGVGFELFDRGDLGVSEFTQKVNLRRAIEGQLARTIGALAGVKSARVTVSLGERGLYRDEDRKPAASVVAMLQPGRTLGERELAGIRHLVSSAVPGLTPEAVTVLDGRGAVLSSDSAWDSPEASYQRKLEQELESRIVALLEPVVGPGSVIARVTAAVDHTTVNQNAEVYDPDQVALRSERKVNEASQNETSAPQGVAGAQANQPLEPQAPRQGPTTQGSSNSNDEVRNYEISRTTTTTVARLPRLQKLSVAVVVNGVDGKPRAAAELAKLAELARKAVGFDEVRGDQFELTSEVFDRPAEVAEAPAPVPTPWWVYAAAGVAALVVVLLVALATRRKKPAAQPDLVLKPGATVAALEALNAPPVDGEEKALPEGPRVPQLVDPIAEVRERARAFARSDPERALLVLRSWLSADLEKQGVESHG